MNVWKKSFVCPNARFVCPTLYNNAVIGKSGFGGHGAGEASEVEHSISEAERSTYEVEELHFRSRAALLWSFACSKIRLSYDPIVTFCYLFLYISLPFVTYCYLSSLSLHLASLNCLVSCAGPNTSKLHPINSNLKANPLFSQEIYFPRITVGWIV